MIRPAFALALLLAGPPAPGQDLAPATRIKIAPIGRPEARVVRVVDGDTIVVELDGKPTTVRLLGIDAPESVAPGKAIEPFARQAASYLRSRVEGRTVTLAFEPVARRIDGRGRTLAWVYDPDGKLVNVELVDRGLARAYVAKPYSGIERFRRAEAVAKSAGVGMWAPGAIEDTAPAPATAGEAGPATVYVTDHGEKYHRQGCRYLSKSANPHDLAKLPARFTPCSKCGPPDRSTTGR